MNPIIDKATVMMLVTTRPERHITTLDLVDMLVTTRPERHNTTVHPANLATIQHTLVTTRPERHNTTLHPANSATTQDTLVACSIPMAWTESPTSHTNRIVDIAMQEVIAWIWMTPMLRNPLDPCLLGVSFDRRLIGVQCLLLREDIMIRIVLVGTSDRKSLTILIDQFHQIPLTTQDNPSESPICDVLQDTSAVHRLSTAGLEVEI